jgi:hypothetical protein
MPTEILDDPSIEDIMSMLEAHGIEIRDFDLSQERGKSTMIPVPEIFDPYCDVAEFEYRLLAMGWLTWEVEQRHLWQWTGLESILRRSSARSACLRSKQKRMKGWHWKSCSDASWRKGSKR